MAEMPIRSQSSLYFERQGLLQRQNTALGMTVYLLGGVSVVLAAGLMVVSLKPKAIYYIPASASGGTVYPGQAPESSVASFTTSWLMDWVNYTPETAAGVYARAARFMSPVFWAKVKSGLEQELSRISQSQIASVFTLRDAPQVKTSADGFEVIFSGVRTAYAGKEELVREDVAFIVQVNKCSPTSQNPYGLSVMDIVKKRISHEGQ